MADTPFDTKTFAQFLEEQQAPAETVTLAGYISRSQRQGAFVLTTGSRRLELPAEAVKSYKVVNEGPPKLVELEILSAKIEDSIPQTDAITDPLIDKQKEPAPDPVVRPENITIEPGSRAPKWRTICNRSVWPRRTTRRAGR